MTLQCINPKDLPVPQTYSQVVVATGSKLVFISGQEPEDLHGKLVKLTAPKSPFPAKVKDEAATTWVRPSLVAQIRGVDE